MSELITSADDSMTKLSKEFGTVYDPSEPLVEEVKKELVEIEDRKNQLVKHDPNLALQDKEFLQQDIKSLILCTRSVLDKLNGELKVGARQGMFEAFAKLTEAATKQYTELRELNQAVVELQLKSSQSLDAINNMGTSKISMTPDQVLDLIDNARANSSINAIEAEFEVADDRDNRKSRHEG